MESKRWIEESMTYLAQQTWITACTTLRRMGQLLTELSAGSVDYVVSRRSVSLSRPRRHRRHKVKRRACELDLLNPGRVIGHVYVACTWRSYP